MTMVGAAAAAQDLEIVAVAQLDGRVGPRFGIVGEDATGAVTRVGAGGAAVAFDLTHPLVGGLVLVGQPVQGSPGD